MKNINYLYYVAPRGYSFLNDCIKILKMNIQFWWSRFYRKDVKLDLHVQLH